MIFKVIPWKYFSELDLKKCTTGMDIGKLLYQYFHYQLPYVKKKRA